MGLLLIDGPTIGAALVWAVAQIYFFIKPNCWQDNWTYDID